MKFSKLFNINSLDKIYREYFTQSLSTRVAAQDVIDAKNRNFKDLYNLIEDSILIFYEIFVKYQATEIKNAKLEETFV